MIRLAIAVLVIGACGGEERADPAPATPTATARPTPVAAPDAAPAPTSAPDAAPPPAAPAIPADRAALFAYLRAGGYRSLPAEPANHPSRGPHSRKGMPVRVFVTPALRDSLAAGAAEHPIGAATVKEMYERDGTTLRGWAVMVKVAAAGGDDGRGWYWYENLGTGADDGADPIAAATGVELCADCHGSGDDFILTRFPR
jgi:hypothetical protein